MQTYLLLINGVLEAGILMTGIREHRLQINGLSGKVEENAEENDKEGIHFRERQKRISVHVVHSRSPVKIFRSIAKEKFSFFH